MTNKLASMFSALSRPVKGKHIDTLTRAFGGKKTLRLLGDEAKATVMRGNKKSQLKTLLRSGEISKSTYKNKLRKFDDKLPMYRGSFVSRHARRFVDDVAHPVRNTKMSLMNMLYTSDKSGNMVNRSAKGLVGQGILNVGLPAWFISDVAKDKTLSTPKKIGKAVAYSALPLSSRKFIPSMIGYSAIDSVFKGKRPNPGGMP